MRKITIKPLTLLMGLCAAVLLAVGCDKAGDKEKSIIGKWTLVGTVDIETGAITELKPKDNRCYYLSFNEDNTFSGISSANDLTGEYTANLDDSTIGMAVRVTTNRAEMVDGGLYLEFLRFVQSFSLPSNKELRLYGTDRQGNDWGKYLLFKRHEADLPLPPTIDWDNYNDVFTIRYNYASYDCPTETSPSGNTGKIIKVEGYIVQPGANLHYIDPSFFYFTNYPNEIFTFNAISIAAIPEISEQMRIKFENSDVTGKCYITGYLIINIYPIGDGCSISPQIVITDADNVIFE